MDGSMSGGDGERAVVDGERAIDGSMGGRAVEGSIDWWTDLLLKPLLNHLLNHLPNHLQDQP